MDIKRGTSRYERQPMLIGRGKFEKDHGVKLADLDPQRIKQLLTEMNKGGFNVRDQFANFERSFPELFRILYPRIYDNIPHHFYSPKEFSCATGFMLLDAGVSGPSVLPAGAQILYTASEGLIQHRMPMWFVQPDLLRAVMQTTFKDKIKWQEMNLPFEDGVFALPKGIITHPNDGDLAFVVWHRYSHKRNYLPLVDISSFYPARPSRSGFGVVGLCHTPNHDNVVWYDANYTAGHRDEIEFGNFLYPDSEVESRATPRPGYNDFPIRAENIDQPDGQFLDRMCHAVFGLLLAMQARPELIEMGSLKSVVKYKDTGKPKEFWSPNFLGRRYVIKRESPGTEHGTHASPRMHWRRGHFRLQPYGPGRTERKQIWLEPCLVAAPKILSDKKENP